MTAAESAEEPSSEDVLALERYLPYRLSVLSNTVSREIARRYQRDFGLSLAEWRVMAVLGRFPGLTASEIVRRTAMDKVTISRAVARLDAAGHLDKAPNPADRRQVALNLSRAGRRVYERIAPLARAYEAELLAALPGGALAILETLIDALTERARALAREA